MSMTVDQLIAELTKVSEGGSGGHRVIIEEQGLGYMGDLTEVNTIMDGPNPTVTLLGEYMEHTPDVWALTIHHKHGENVDLFRSEQAARLALADWARQYWHELPGDPEMPDESFEAPIDLYFDLHEQEWYTLDVATVRG